MSTIVARLHSFVIGVDTHAKTHTYAVLAGNGEHLATEAFPNTHAGRARAIAWAGRCTGKDLGALGVIEGVGSYGAQLARQARLAGYRRSRQPTSAALADEGSASPTRSMPTA